MVTIYKWPDLPPLPPPGKPLLLRLATSISRQTARLEVRAVLHSMLAAWCGIPADQLPLAETKNGPAWIGLPDGPAMDISLSYSGDEGWIGLIRGGSIGIDAMRIQHIPEFEEVARNYLDPSALKEIRQAPDPDTAFAQAWTQLEARLKCMKRKLKEWNDRSAKMMAACEVQTAILSEGMVVSVATIPAGKHYYS
jgi:4'-phosphopantetheinyl transferase